MENHRISLFSLPSFIRSCSVLDGSAKSDRSFEKLVKGEFVCNHRVVSVKLEIDSPQSWLIHAKSRHQNLKTEIKKELNSIYLQLCLDPGPNEIRFEDLDGGRVFVLPLIHKGAVREQMDLMAKGLIQVTCFVTFCFQISFIPSGSMMNTLIEGDYILVDKMAFFLREPRRNEIATFDFPLDPSRAFIKRIIGLPNEEIAVKDQKVWIDQKELSELQTLNLFVIYSHEGRAEINPFVLFGKESSLEMPSHLYALVWPDSLKIGATSCFAANIHEKPLKKIDLKDINDTKFRVQIEVFASEGSKITKKGDLIECDGVSVPVHKLRFYLLAPLRMEDPAGQMEPIKLGENEYIVMGDNRDNSQDSRFWGTITRWDLKGKPLFRMIPVSRAGLIRP